MPSGGRSCALGFGFSLRVGSAFFFSFETRRKKGSLIRDPAASVSGIEEASQTTQPDQHTLVTLGIHALAFFRVRPVPAGRHSGLSLGLSASCPECASFTLVPLGCGGWQTFSPSHWQSLLPIRCRREIRLAWKIRKCILGIAFLFLAQKGI